MTIDAVIATLNKIRDRAELVAFLAPLRLPLGLSEKEKAKITSALIRATARCWKELA
jgi:hypothetical protein